MPSAKKAEDTSTPRARKPSPAKGAAAEATTGTPAAAKAPARKAAAKPSARSSTAVKGAGTKAAGTTATASKDSATKGTASKATATKGTSAKRSATKAAPAPAPAPAEAPEVLGGGDEFLAAQRTLLLQEREAHTRQAAGLRAEAEQLAEERDPGDVQFDEESGQGDTMNVERERDLALSAQAMQQVLEIDAALEKIDKGTYGLCERCGKPIPKERLQALPWAALDVGCKSMGFARR